MKKIHIALGAAVACLLFAAVAMPRQAEPPAARTAQPRFLNAKVERQSVGVNFAGAIATAIREHQSPAWIGYSVAATPGDHGMCDADRPRRIYLEGRPPRTTVEDRSGPAVDLAILVRVEAGTIRKLRVTSVNCEVDAGGLPVAWLTGVTGAESVSWLRDLVDRSDPTVRIETGVMAIALHADQSAGRVLEEFTAPGRATSLRKRAVFWLGVGRGDVTTLVRLARGDESLDIRKEAMFWLSRSRDPRAIAFTEEILRK